MVALKKLKELRLKAEHHQHKLSAIILLKGRPVSFGFNNGIKTHPKASKYTEYPTLHAEMSAIFKVKNKDILRYCTLVVYREDRMGNLAMSRPCVACQQLIKECGIKKVVYTTKDGWIEESFV